MSDTVKAWIEERRAIHAAATDGPWKARPGDEIEGPGGDNLMGGDMEYFSGFMLRGENATAVVDAHNNLPRALDALNKVLELHKPVETEPSDTICGGCSNQLPNGRFMPVVEYPCATVQAIEGAIND